MSKIYEKDSLGQRIKQYEKNYSNVIDKKEPVIIRLDGVAFHTYTKHMEKPFSNLLMNAMNHTTKELFKRIQNCVCGYCQSDEITLYLIGDKNPNTDVWFGNKIQKLTSVSASMATLFFNSYIRQYYTNKLNDTDENEVCGEIIIRNIYK